MALPFDLIDKGTEGILRWGDVVSFFMDPSASSTKSDGKVCDDAVLDGGFLAAEGLVDDDLTIEKLCSDENPKDIQPPANFRDCLFRLWPAFTYSMQEEYAHYVRQSDALKDPAQEAKLLRLKDDEEKQNYEDQRTLFGSLIHYGDRVQFQHLKSDKFLTLFPRLVSAKDPSCLSVKLDKSGNENSWIVIRPHLKHRSIGAFVEVGDQLSICFKTQAEGQLNAFTGAIKDVNLSVNQKMAWKVLRYYDAPSFHVSSVMSEEKKGMRVGQMVLLKFPQGKSYLTANSDVFGVTAPNIRFQPLAVETSSSATSPLDSSSDIVWVVQRKHSHCGRHAAWDMTFFLRHFNTGYYLCYNDTNGLHMSKDRAHALSVCLRRTSTKNPEAIIKDNSTLYIGHKRDGEITGWLCADTNDYTRVSLSSDAEFMHEASFILDSLKDEEVRDVEYCLMLSRHLWEAAKELAAKISTDMSLWNTVGHKGDTEDIRTLLSHCVDYCIRLVCFLTDDLPVADVLKKKFPDFGRRARHFQDFLKHATRPKPARQVLMREQGLFSHCFSILLSIGEGLDKIEADTRRWPNYTNSLSCIGFLIYEAIQVGCSHHRENESSVAKLEIRHAADPDAKPRKTFDIMIDHLDLDIGAAETLSSLIDNNKKLLEEEISPARLEKFYQIILERGLRPVYLQIFAAVCGYGGVSLPEKQIAVGRKLLESQPKIFLETVVIDPSSVLDGIPEMLATYGDMAERMFNLLFKRVQSHSGQRLQFPPAIPEKNQLGINFRVPIGIVEHTNPCEGQVSVVTYWQAAEERINSAPVAIEMCDTDNGGGGAHELYVVGHNLDTSFKVAMPTFQELYTWYELEDVDVFVYPCQLEKGSPGSVEMLNMFKIPQKGETTVYRDYQGTVMHKTITTVYRAWIKYQTEAGKIVAAVPLRLLAHLGTAAVGLEKKQIHKPEKVKRYMQQYYRYYICQLKLFREMSYSRNYFGIHKIQQMLPVDVMLSGMNAVHRAEVRRHFCDLIMSVYVDSKDQHELQIPFNARPWNKIADKDVFPSCEDNAQFAMLQAFVQRYLGQDKVQSCDPSKKQETMLTMSVLKLCELLFKFGFYSSTMEIKQINASLLMGMDPRTDSIQLKMSSTHIAIGADTSGHASDDEFETDKKKKKKKKEKEKLTGQKKVLKIIDGAAYTVVLLVLTIISTTLGILEIIFGHDDHTEANYLRLSNDHEITACKENRFSCPSQNAILIVGAICTFLFVVDVIVRLSVTGREDFFSNYLSVIDFVVTVFDVITLVFDLLVWNFTQVLEFFLLLRLLRIGRIVTLQIKKKKKKETKTLLENVWLRPDVNDFFRERAKDVENETTIMLTNPRVMNEYKTQIAPRYNPRGKGDLVFQVKNLQVQLLTQVQNLEAEYHVLQLLVNMKQIKESETGGDQYGMLIELFKKPRQQYQSRSSKRNEHDVSTTREELQDYLLDLVLFTDKSLVESSLNLLLLSSRSKKNLVELAKRTNLMVGPEINDLYLHMRDVRLSIKAIVDSFEMWGFIEREGNQDFVKCMDDLKRHFDELAGLNMLEGTELQLALIDEGIIGMLKSVIDIPNMYRGIGYTKFDADNQDSFYISDDVKNDEAVYGRVLEFIEKHLLDMLGSFTNMLLSLLGYGEKSEQNRKVQTSMFKLVNDLLPWVGTVPRTELIITSTVLGNENLCNSINDAFIEDCAKQFNDPRNPDLPKKDVVAIMIIISGITCQDKFVVPRNQKRLVSQLCKTKHRQGFLTNQVELTYRPTTPEAAHCTPQREANELLRMVAHLCVGEINITEAKMLELVDFGSVLGAVLASSGNWKSKFFYLNLFFHMVVDAELKIDALSQHRHLTSLLNLFAQQLAVLCGWNDNPQKQYPEFPEGKLLQILNENPDMFNGSPFNLSFKAKRRDKTGASFTANMSDPIVLIRYSVNYIARICRRLFLRYGEDLSNLNGVAIRDITYCSARLLRTSTPSLYGGKTQPTRAVIEFCKTMETLHAATAFIDSNYGGGQFEKKFDEWLVQHHEIVGASVTAKEFDLFCKPSPKWAEFQMPEHSEDIQSASTAESKSDQNAANANRTKVRKEFAKFIKKVRKDSTLKDLQVKENDTLLAKLIATLKKQRHVDQEKKHKDAFANKHESVDEVESVVTLPNFVYCVVQHLRNALKPSPQEGRRKIFLAPYTSTPSLLYSIKLFTSLITKMKEQILPKDKSDKSKVSSSNIFNRFMKAIMTDSSSTVPGKESSSNVIKGLIECELLEFCFEMMPDGINRGFRTKNNTLKLLRDFLHWSFESGELEALQKRSVKVLSKQGGVMARSASFFFGVEDIFTKATQHIKYYQFDDTIDGRATNFLTEFDSTCDILKYLLEGHFAPMQGLMLKQVQLEVEDINILALVTKFLRAASRELILLSNEDLPGALDRIVKALGVVTEAVQGPCSANQNFVHRTGLLESANRILRRFDDVQGKPINMDLVVMRTKLQKFVFNTLIAMLEGRKDHHVQTKIIGKFAIEIILRNILAHSTRQKHQLLHGTYFTEKEEQYFDKSKNPDHLCDNATKMKADMQECANTAGVLWMKLTDVDKQFGLKRLDRKLRKFCEPEEKEAFEKWIGDSLQTVEVMWHSREGALLLNEHFPIPELANLTNPTTFQNMELTADRSSTETKLAHFLKNVGILYSEVDWEQVISTTKGIKYVCTTPILDIVSKAFLYLAILVAGLIIVSYQRNNEVMQAYFSDVQAQRTSYGHKNAFECVLTHGTWWMFDICYLVDVILWVLLLLSILSLVMQLVLHAVPLYKKQDKSWVKTVVRTPLAVAFIKIFLVLIIISNNLPAMIMVVALLEFLRNDAAQTVIRSVTEPIKTLAVSLLFILAFIAFFAIIIFQFFPKDFFDNDLVCQSLLTCFVECLNYGMRNGGGVGDSMFPHNYETHAPLWFLRTVLDLIFFLLINIVLLNVVFGIIIDKFGSFRDDKLSIMEDMENTCYICGKERSEISQFIDYNDHTTTQHGLMRYWNFILYLKTKPKNEMTGLQHYVLDLVENDKNNQVKWFPIGRSRELENVKENNKNNRSTLLSQ